MFKPTIVYFAAVLAVFLSTDHQIHAFSTTPPLTLTTTSARSATTRSNVISVEQPYTAGTALFAGKGGEGKTIKKKKKVPSQKLFYALLFSFVTVDFLFFHTVFNK